MTSKRTAPNRRSLIRDLRQHKAAVDKMLDFIDYGYVLAEAERDVRGFRRQLAALGRAVMLGYSRLDKIVTEVEELRDGLLEIGDLIADDLAHADDPPDLPPPAPPPPSEPAHD